MIANIYDLEEFVLLAIEPDHLSLELHVVVLRHRTLLDAVEYVEVVLGRGVFVAFISLILLLIVLLEHVLDALIIVKSFHVVWCRNLLGLLVVKRWRLIMMIVAIDHDGLVVVA